jgi:hypothetical protein
MAGIEYRSITRRETESGQPYTSAPGDNLRAASIPRTGVQAPDRALSAIRCMQDIDPDDVCGIVALDGDKIIGRISLLYTQLLVDGQLQKCAVGSSFFVDQNYRGRAVGLSILLKVLSLGIPYIEAGVSAQMRMILEKFQKFKLVDQSPIFTVPLDRTGIVQMARWHLYSPENRTNGYIADKFMKVRIVGSLWFQRRRIRRAASIPIRTMGTDQALEYCRDHFDEACFRVQLPWTAARLRRAFSGDDPNHAAWLVSVGADGPWLVSLYRRERALRSGDNGQQRTLVEAHLSEIYPPPRSVANVLPLLSFALKRAENMSVHVLHIHATAPVIVEACLQSGLRSRTKRSTFIAPSGVDTAARNVLGDPDNWWCRAFSEDQLEESFTPVTTRCTASCVLTFEA